MECTSQGYYAWRLQTTWLKVCLLYANQQIQSPYFNHFLYLILTHWVSTLCPKSLQDQMPDNWGLPYLLDSTDIIRIRNLILLRLPTLPCPFLSTKPQWRLYFLPLPLLPDQPWCFRTWPCVAKCSVSLLLGTASNKLSQFKGSYLVTCWPHHTWITAISQVHFKAMLNPIW